MAEASMTGPQQIVVLTRDELKTLIREAIDEYQNRRADDQNSTGNGEDHYLTVEEAAGKLNVTVSWLYRHAGKLPFARKLSRKVLRFSESGLLRWQAARRQLIP
jgi:excisionase family DNA binding protein